jgi:hypothetical protein
MKIYLDIDGTLIHEDLDDFYGKPAEGLSEFLIALRPHETFWLTTHCMDGDPSHARRKLKMVVPEELYPDVDRIKPTTWQSLKTEALDWESDFIWFDNDIIPEEWARFLDATPDQRVIEVDLNAHPDHLIDLRKDLFGG